MCTSLPLHPCPIQSSLLSPAAPQVPSPLSDGRCVFQSPFTQLTIQLSSAHPPGYHFSAPSTAPKRCPHSLSKAGYYVSPNDFSKGLHPFLEILYLQNLGVHIQKALLEAKQEEPSHSTTIFCLCSSTFHMNSQIFTPCSFKFLDTGY